MPFSIIRNDITRVSADAIVNTANPQPIYGPGTDQAIYEAAGKEKLLKARQKIGVLKPGEAAVTFAGWLKARYIIHTVGPVWQGGDHQEREILANCYRNALKLAEKKHCKSIAFPLISAGSYGFPKPEALNIALREIRAFLETSDMNVLLVVYDKAAFQLSEKLQSGIRSFIDDSYVRMRIQETGIQYERRGPGASAPLLEEEICSYESDTMFASRPLMLEEARPSFSAAPMPEPVKAKKARQGKRSLKDIPLQVGETFQQHLFRMIDERGMTDVEVYKRANLDKKLFSKIRCKADYKPRKDTVLALCIALKLNLDETKDLLSYAGLALSPSSVQDLILEFFITEEVYDIFTINSALFEHDQPCLGSF